MSDSNSLKLHIALPRDFSKPVDDPYNRHWHEEPFISVDTQVIADMNLHRPLNWVRYLGFTIVGEPGELSSSKDSIVAPGPLSFDTTTILYFHTRGLVNPADFRAGATETSTQVSGSRCAEFASDVSERDGRCFFTSRVPLSCDAVHLIRHNKGDNYIDMATNSTVSTIDDPRNGLLLNIVVHRFLGLNLCAILHTPNMYMISTDVHNNYPAMQRMLTLQHFRSLESEHDLCPPNCTKPIPDSPTFPPLVIFDFCYGSAALKAWGNPAFLGDALAESQSSYYTGGQQALQERKAHKDQQRKRNKHSRNAHDNAAQGMEIDAWDVLLMFRGKYFEVPVDDNPERGTGCPKEVHEKVSSWLESSD
ncbi:hypothetical protein Hypma_000150 [Hypsizygus marmoreus]|uniref:HNH nuclease domain-containing protein n=1 Tax=Hypsizygus marmoreus TaxID=39966 RepID=A0A369K8R5_HYPMA|nr:hypothetical protein Hypma_000150 [Hypsizygus marmoreus]